MGFKREVKIMVAEVESRVDSYHRNIRYEIGTVSKLIHKRRIILTGIEADLRTLNEQYPGERIKKIDEQNPDFRQSREYLLGDKRSLTPSQHLDRLYVRGKLRWTQNKGNGDRRGY